MQEELAASVLPQAFAPVVMAKSARFVPEMIEPLMVMGVVLLVLLSVALIGALV
jgi:hypothetical protein